MSEQVRQSLLVRFDRPVLAEGWRHMGKSQVLCFILSSSCLTPCSTEQEQRCKAKNSIVCSGLTVIGPLKVRSHILYIFIRLKGVKETSQSAHKSKES